MRVQVTILLAITTTLAAQENAQVYCGRRLARTLAVLCSESYAKRSGYYGNYGVGKQESDESLSDHGIGYQYVDWVKERAHGLSGSRSKRQVVTECCDKACTIEEMMTYC